MEAIRVGTALPVRDVKRLTRLLCDKIETVDPGFGIEIMSLAATLAEPLAPKQMISSLTEEPEADVSGLIDTLANRVGEQRLYRFAPVASDVPERSVARVAPTAPDTGEGWPDHWPRPARLLPHPEPIETVALLPDHPPVTFTWRGVRRRVKRADGPERVFGEWWKRDAELIAVRDYFQVEDEAGERFWIYRAGDGEDAGDRLAPLVPAWDLRMSGARYVELQVHLAFLVPARRELLRGAVRAGRAARHRGAGDRRPQFARRHRPRPRGRQDDRRAADRRLPARSRRRHVRAGLSDRPAGLCAALPAAVARQEARRQGASAGSTGPISSPMARD